MNEAPETRTAIQKRFGDVDMFHHVNNVAQQSYFDVGKVDYYNRILGYDMMDCDVRIVTVSTSTSYLGQIRRYDDIEVVTRVEKVGNKSLTIFQQLLCNGEVRSESRSVMVAFDFVAQLSVPVPDEWRRKMLGL